jgi:hypothetical protein
VLALVSSTHPSDHLGEITGEFTWKKGWIPTSERMVYSSRNEDPTINNGDFITLHLGLTHQHVVI